MKGDKKEEWTLYTDPQTGHPYWYNAVTGESAWAEEAATQQSRDEPDDDAEEESVEEEEDDDEDDDDDEEDDDDDEDDEDDDDASSEESSRRPHSSSYPLSVTDCLKRRIERWDVGRMGSDLWEKWVRVRE